MKQFIITEETLNNLKQPDSLKKKSSKNTFTWVVSF